MQGAHVARTTLTTAQLYAVLDREFRKRRAASCTTCSVPLPYWRAAPDDVSANWVIGSPTVCPRRCHVVIAELVTLLWSRYDVADPGLNASRFSRSDNWMR
jgi:hypothetical protein